jgi:hypothetical protein
MLRFFIGLRLALERDLKFLNHFESITEWMSAKGYLNNLYLMNERPP